jgi:hypothetical protein
MNVWVVFAQGRRTVQTRDPTVPLAGGPMSIFAAKVTHTEEHHDCVAVLTDHDMAMACKDWWVAGHPQDRVQVKVRRLDDWAAPAEPTPPACTECGVPSSTGMCRACQVRLWERSRAADPELLEEIERAELEKTRP